MRKELVLWGLAWVLVLGVAAAAGSLSRIPVNAAASSAVSSTQVAPDPAAQQAASANAAASSVTSSAQVAPGSAAQQASPKSTVDDEQEAKESEAAERAESKSESSSESNTEKDTPGGHQDQDGVNVQHEFVGQE